MSRVGLRALLVGSIAASIAVVPRPATAKRTKGPTQITPTKQSGKARRQSRRADVDRSEGGTRQGVLELSLGSVVTGTSLLLVGRGIWEVGRIQRTIDECNAGAFLLDCELENPGRQGSIAAGLSFGFAAVMGLAGGFLLVRGARIHRDYREFKAAQARVTVQPWASVRRPSGGLSLRVRF